VIIFQTGYELSIVLGNESTSGRREVISKGVTSFLTLMVPDSTKLIIKQWACEKETSRGLEGYPIQWQLTPRPSTSRFQQIIS
jgi:hypothetical protein